MRATSPHAVIVLCCLLLSSSSSSARALRVLVTPLVGDGDSSVQQTLTRAVETAIARALPRAEVISATTIETSVALSQLRDCANDVAASSCWTDIADAANAEIVVRPHLGRLGDELVLSLSVLEGPTARLLSQGQRRVRADSPAGLLDVIPRLVRDVATDAYLLQPRVNKGPPVAPIAVAVVGAVVAVGGAAALWVRNVDGINYENGDANRDDATWYEDNEAALLIGGVGAVVVGGVMAAVGAIVAVVGATSEE